MLRSGDGEYSTSAFHFQATQNARLFDVSIQKVVTLFVKSDANPTLSRTVYTEKWSSESLGTTDQALEGDRMDSNNLDVCLQSTLRLPSALEVNGHLKHLSADCQVTFRLHHRCDNARAFLAQSSIANQPCALQIRLHSHPRVTLAFLSRTAL